jgi:hypothetical protein
VATNLTASLAKKEVRRPASAPPHRAAFRLPACGARKGKARDEDEIETAFSSLAQLHADALIVPPDPFLTSRREQLLALAYRH